MKSSGCPSFHQPWCFISPTTYSEKEWPCICLYERSQKPPLYGADIIGNAIKNAILVGRKEGQYFSMFLSKLAWLGQAWPGQAWQCPARQGRAGQKVWACVYGADLLENELYIETHCLRSILIISGPSRPQKNGSGSKFYVGERYREVWKSNLSYFMKNYETLSAMLI